MCMKPEQCTDDEGISAEHLLNAPLAMLTCISPLFDQFLRHSFATAQFKSGFIVPIFKITKAFLLTSITTEALQYP